MRQLLGWPVRVWQRMNLQLRLAVWAAVGLLLALAISGAVLVAVLQVALERGLDAAAQQTGRDVAALVDADEVPNPIPAGGTTVVQVIDRTGRVRAASAGADRLVPMLTPADLAELREGKARYEPGYRFGVDDVVRVVAMPAGAVRGDPQTVLVAVPAGDLYASIKVVKVSLLTGYTILLMVLAALAWRVVGAALRPVEALRRSAEEITGARSAAQLPVPKAKDEIYRLAVTLNTMLARLDAARARQRAFVADAAHELRSPLASLRTQVEVAEVTGEPADPAELLEDVQRLTRLVDDLLLLAKVEDGPVRRADVVDLADVVERVVARAAGARVDVVRAPLPPELARDTDAPTLVAGDADELTRVVANLVENAVRYAATTVEVRLGLAAGAGPGRVLIEVVDDGPGIPIGERERVFARFARQDAARDRASGGAGLGLSIVRELVRRHEGTIWLASARPGEDPPGLRVSIRLPAAP